VHRQFALWLLTAILTTLTTVAGRQALGAPVPPTEYVFIPDTERLVAIARGGVEAVGKLDAEGNFMQHFTVERGRPFSGPYYHLLTPSDQKPRKVYEYRSGRLIKGEQDEKGNFVPEVGSTVTKFEDYKYGPDVISIWNLPGYFLRRDKLEERRKWLAEHLAENPEYAQEKARLDAAVGDRK
jgi:hypothetical protein